MKLAVSNLAFGGEQRERAYATLAQLGVEGVEVALTRLASWDEISPAICRAEAAALAAAGLCASSLQAIYFNRPDLQLLGDESSFGGLLDHTRRVAECGEALGATVAVFGAPKNRARGVRSVADAVALAAERFRRLGDAVQPHAVRIGIEPVPSHYGSDFLLTAETSTDMVRRVDHPNVRLHLDTACVALGGGDIGNAVRAGSDVLVHMHAAEADLGEFDAPSARHEVAASALLAADYDGWVAIEMREASDRPWAAIETAVSYVRATYWAGRSPTMSQAD